MNKIKRISIIVIISTILFSINIFAAEGSFSISKTDYTITEGATNTFTITATNCEGKFSITSSNTNVANVSESSVWITGSKQITITAIKEGNATITIKAVNVGDTNENDVTGSKTISVTVKAKEETSTKKEETTTKKTDTTTTKTTTKSSNAYLKTLGVRPSEYDFSGFSKDKTEYSVTVPASVDSLKVVATAAENGSTKITGNSGFETGSNNKISVVVTSEDGKNTKTYTINVTKLAEEDEKTGNIIDDNDDSLEKNEELYLTELKINGIDISPEFNKDVYSYTATLNKDKSEVEVTAKANTEDAKIEITGNTSLVNGENIINVILSLNDENKVYQIVLNKEISNTSDNQETGLIDGLLSHFKKFTIGAVAMVIILIAAIVILICLIIKEHKELSEEEDEEYYKSRKTGKGKH